MEIAKDVEAGQAVYSRLVLSIYDMYVFGFSNKLAWKCPTERLVQNYNEHVSANHLDIGVGTGFLLDTCRFPVDRPYIGLLDLNRNSLDVTAKRISRYRPIAFRRNVFEPLAIGQHKYDSVGMNYLLHCLPGTMESKAVVFDNILEVLNPDGVVFGATLVQQGVRVGWLGRRLMAIYNRKGIFSNAGDGVADIERILSARFSEYALEVCGCAAIFSGRL